MVKYGQGTCQNVINHGQKKNKEIRKNLYQHG